MAIIQLTDIHLDATYGGKFPTMVHLDKVIQDILKISAGKSASKRVLDPVGLLVMSASIGGNSSVSAPSIDAIKPLFL